MREIATIRTQRALDGMQRVNPIVIMFIVIRQISESGLDLPHLAVEFFQIKRLLRCRLPLTDTPLQRASVFQRHAAAFQKLVQLFMRYQRQVTGSDVRD